MAVQAIQEVLSFMKAVRLARVHDEFGFDAVALEAAVEFLALAGDRPGRRPLGESRSVFHILGMDEWQLFRNPATFSGS